MYLVTFNHSRNLKLKQGYTFLAITITLSLRPAINLYFYTRVMIANLLVFEDQVTAPFQSAILLPINTKIIDIFTDQTPHTHSIEKRKNITSVI